ncbi:unnamed protein product, partial [Protopolystoma xenopodis]
SVNGGFIVHPDRQHYVYPLGCTVVIEDINEKKQEFLHGHSNNVVCLDISKCGKWIASGQTTHMGYKADVIVWNYLLREPYAKFTLHKVKVQALCFSPNAKYLATLGGQDDGRCSAFLIESILVLLFGLFPVRKQYVEVLLNI